MEDFVHRIHRRVSRLTFRFFRAFRAMRRRASSSSSAFVSSPTVFFTSSRGGVGVMAFSYSFSFSFSYSSSFLSCGTFGTSFSVLSAGGGVVGPLVQRGASLSPPSPSTASVSFLSPEVPSPPLLRATTAAPTPSICRRR